MKTYSLEVLQPGELVEAALDNAAEYTSDPDEVSRLATRAVVHMLLHQRRSEKPERRSDPHLAR